MHENFTSILSSLINKSKTLIKMLFNISGFHILNNHLFVIENSWEHSACVVRNIKNVCDILFLQLLFRLCTKCISNKYLGNNLVHLL